MTREKLDRELAKMENLSEKELREIYQRTKIVKPHRSLVHKISTLLLIFGLVMSSSLYIFSVFILFFPLDFKNFMEKMETLPAPARIEWPTNIQLGAPPSFGCLDAETIGRNDLNASRVIDNCCLGPELFTK